MCAHNTLRTSRATLLTKLTHPVVVDFNECWGLEGVDAIGAFARRRLPGDRKTSRSPMQDAKAGHLGRAGTAGGPHRPIPRERGNRSPPRSLRCLSRDTPARLTPWLCSGPCTGPSLGQAPSPRGLGPQRVERAWTISPPRRRRSHRHYLTYPKRITAQTAAQPKQLRTRRVRFR